MSLLAKCFLKNSFIILLLSIPSSLHAEVWEWSCESAIRKLKNAQEEAASAKTDIDSAKSYYELCTPSRYNTCEFERTALNNAIDDFNSAISDFDFALTSFKNSCLD